MPLHNPHIILSSSVLYKGNGAIWEEKSQCAWMQNMGVKRGTSCELLSSYCWVLWCPLQIPVSKDLFWIQTYRICCLHSYQCFPNLSPWALSVHVNLWYHLFLHLPLLSPACIHKVRMSQVLTGFAGRKDLMWGRTLMALLRHHPSAVWHSSTDMVNIQYISPWRLTSAKGTRTLFVKMFFGMAVSSRMEWSEGFLEVVAQVFRRTGFLFFLISNEQGFQASIWVWWWIWSYSPPTSEGIRPSCHPEAACLCSLLCTGLPDLDVSGHTQYKARALTSDLCFRSPRTLFWLLSTFKVLCMLESHAGHIIKSADNNTGFMRSCSTS